MSSAACISPRSEFISKPIDHHTGIPLEEPLEDELGNVETGARRQLVCDCGAAIRLYGPPGTFVDSEALAASIDEPEGIRCFCHVQQQVNRLREHHEPGHCLLLDDQSTRSAFDDDAAADIRHEAGDPFVSESTASRTSGGWGTSNRAVTA